MTVCQDERHACHKPEGHSGRVQGNHFWIEHLGFSLYVRAVTKGDLHFHLVFLFQLVALRTPLPLLSRNLVNDQKKTGLDVLSLGEEPLHSSWALGLFKSMLGHPLGIQTEITHVWMIILLRLGRPPPKKPSQGDLQAFR